MKKIKILATVFMTMVLGAGVLVGANSFEKDTIEVEAAQKVSPTAKRCILFEDNWVKAPLKIHYWGGSSESSWDSRPSMIQSSAKNGSGKYIYYYNVPSDTTGFLLTNNDNNQKTVDIILSTFSSKGNCGYWNWTGNDGDNVSNYGVYNCTNAALSSKVIYNSNTATNTTINQSFYWGKLVTLQSCTFQNSGFFFKEWNTKSDGSGTSYNSGDSFYTSSENVTLYAIWDEVSYNVEEYNVFDGVVDTTPFSTTSQGVSYIPTQVEKEGFVAKGVYTNPECTEEFDGVLSSDTKLYHSYVTEQFNYIYLRGLDKDKWSNATDDPTSVHLYVWAENGALLNGAWPGNEITLSDYVCEGVNFDSRGLYRIPLLVNGDEAPANFIIYTEYNDGTKQSADLTVTFGAYYYMNSLVKGSEDKNEIAGNLDVGAQAELAFKVNDARLAATDEYEFDGKTYTNSICSFDQATAVDILDSYDALNSKTVFDETSFWTNNVENRPDGMGNVQEDGNYYGHEIITSLRTLFPQTNPSNALFTSENVNNSGFVVAIIVLVATAGIVVFLVSKKRKSLSK